ncbi:MAG: DUF4197 domain-containing protein [Desulfovibrionaceae bacterium]|nr:DUF4197 domain-containing protein [Desulfovibrionaceae bacterium]
MRLSHIPPAAALAAALFLAASVALAAWGDVLKATGLSAAGAKAESAVKEVLTLGKNYAIETLGKDGGFSDNAYAAIGLPESFSTLAAASGLTSLLNSAAETAVPKLDAAFDQTIQGLDLSDPMPLLTAAKDSTGVTDYFDAESRSALMEMARPIVKTSLNDAGLSSYATVLSLLAKTTDFDAVDYTAEQVLDAMFHYMGEKEKDLRASGAEGASKLLQTFF